MCYRTVRTLFARLGIHMTSQTVNSGTGVRCTRKLFPLFDITSLMSVTITEVVGGYRSEGERIGLLDIKKRMRATAAPSVFSLLLVVVSSLGQLSHIQARHDDSAKAEYITKQRNET